MAASGSLFAGRPRTGSSKLGAQVDADGNELEVLRYCQTLFQLEWLDINTQNFVNLEKIATSWLAFTPGFHILFWLNVIQFKFLLAEHLPFGDGCWMFCYFPVHYLYLFATYLRFRYLDFGNLIYCLVMHLSMFSPRGGWGLPRKLDSSEKWESNFPPIWHNFVFKIPWIGLQI